MKTRQMANIAMLAGGACLAVVIALRSDGNVGDWETFAFLGFALVLGGWLTKAVAK